MADWSFLTSQARVLLCIAHDPGVRLRDIASAPSSAFSTASFGIRIRPLGFLAASGRSASGFRPEKAGVAAPMSIQPATTPLIRRVPPAEQNTRIGAHDSGTVAGPRTG